MPMPRIESRTPPRRSAEAAFSAVSATEKRFVQQAFDWMRRAQGSYTGTVTQGPPGHPDRYAVTFELAERPKSPGTFDFDYDVRGTKQSFKKHEEMRLTNGRYFYFGLDSGGKVVPVTFPNQKATPGTLVFAFPSAEGPPVETTMKYDGSLLTAFMTVGAGTPKEIDASFDFKRQGGK